LKKIKVGSRGSLLAMAQAELVVSSLKEKFPSLEIEAVTIKTTGDKIQDSPLSKIGTKSLFTKEIEEALMENKIDLAVHSLKDLPTEIPEVLALGAVTEREDPHDCLISSQGWTLKTLPQGARMGTSSLRRQAQILSLRCDLIVESLRGNLDTRIRKLQQGRFDAIVVAKAGVKRLGKSLSMEGKGLVLKMIPYAEMLPAVGQGSLAIEVRKSDSETGSIVKALNHGVSYAVALCERAFLAALQGGCQVPIGALAEASEGTLFLEGVIVSLQGDKVVRDKTSGHIDRSVDLGDELGKRLLGKGGKEILESIRSHGSKEI
jgi:hydroxymethylbilane synthase